jgi:hypothetical protein
VHATISFVSNQPCFDSLLLELRFHPSKTALLENSFNSKNVIKDIIDKGLE